jgi:hypothetical protein
MRRFAARPDHERGGVPFGKSLRVDEDAIVRRAVIVREIDDWRRAGRLRGDGDELRRGRFPAGCILHAVDVVDHREVGGVGIARNRNPHRRKRRILGKADMEIGVPGDGRDLHVSAPIARQGLVPGKNSTQARAAAAITGIAETRNFKRNMIRTRSQPESGLMVGGA